MRPRMSTRCIFATGCKRQDFYPVVAAPDKRRCQKVLHEVKPDWTITKEYEGYMLEPERQRLVSAA